MLLVTFEASSLFTKEFLQTHFHIGILLLKLADLRLDFLEAFLLVLVVASRRVLLMAKVLDLLGAVADVRQAKGRRRPLEKVTELRQVFEIFLLAGSNRLVDAHARARKMCDTYMLACICLNVFSACSKNPNTIDLLNSSSSSSSISRIWSNVALSRLSPRSSSAVLSSAVACFRARQLLDFARVMKESYARP